MSDADGRVEAIGGLFWRAADPEALGAWYRTHLGIEVGGPWPMSAGPAVVSPFKAGTDYWDAGKQWMLNLRVSGLDALVTRLETAGIAAERRTEEWDHPEVGRFARIHDPEGNAIELWGAARCLNLIIWRSAAPIWPRGHGGWKPRWARRCPISVIIRRWAPITG